MKDDALGLALGRKLTQRSPVLRHSEKGLETNLGIYVTRPSGTC